MLIRVMVVDDHDLVREAVGAILDAEPDIQVVASCSDGQDAIEQLHHARPDVVLTDLAMPRLNGVDTIRHIRRQQPRVQVLVLTSTPHGHGATDALTAGAHAVLAKNAGLAAIPDAVRAAHAEV